MSTQGEAACSRLHCRALPFSSSEPHDAPRLWSRLKAGELRVQAYYHTDTELHLDLFEATDSVPGASAAPTRNALTLLDRLMLGESQKVLAITNGVSPSTISVKILGELRALGLRCSSGSLPTALVLLARISHGQPCPFRVEVETLVSGGQTFLRVSIERPDRYIHKQLTPAERQLAAFMIEGLTHREMARRRIRAQRTIANQIGRLYRKLGVSRRISLISALLEG